MPEIDGENFVFLEDVEFPPGMEATLPSFWNLGLGRSSANELLAWIFQLDGGKELPRGYLDSVRQRYSQWSRLKEVPETIDLIFEEIEREEEGRSSYFAAYLPDGETLSAYLARNPSLSERTALRLVLEMIAWLRALVAAPRLLANVALEDFIVCARDGVILSITFCPVLCLLRDETPMSDFRIARVWTERCASIHSFLRGARKGGPGDVPPTDNRAFRSLFKNLDTGKDRALFDRIGDVEAVIQAEYETAGKSDRFSEYSPLQKAFPIGPLARLLRGRAIAVAPERFTDTPAGSGELVVFSSFRLEESAPREGGARVGYLLPPEHWFDESLVDPLNRRLSHPFLKAHHNCLRIRSVYCDEHLTLLTGDPIEGIPLPSLLGARGGMDREDLLLIVGKLHRALAQFESAGYEPFLVSPWQVELHLESGVKNPGWERLIETAIGSWPPWEVIIRVERPAEAYLPGESSIAWRWVRFGLSDKFFPALVAWILDWKRFQWAARSGTLAKEPLSWDDRFVALFRAAGEHLDPARASQREKFLDLIEECLSSD